MDIGGDALALGLFGADQAHHQLLAFGLDGLEGSQGVGELTFQASRSCPAHAAMSSLTACRIGRASPRASSIDSRGPSASCSSTVGRGRIDGPLSHFCSAALSEPVCVGGDQPEVRGVLTDKVRCERGVRSDDRSVTRLASKPCHELPALRAPVENQHETHGSGRPSIREPWVIWRGGGKRKELRPRGWLCCVHSSGSVTLSRAEGLPYTRPRLHGNPFGQSVS